MFAFAAERAIFPLFRAIRFLIYNCSNFSRAMLLASAKDNSSFDSWIGTVQSRERTSEGKRSGMSMSVFSRRYARSRMFSNSLTLPGQSYAFNTSLNDGWSLWMFLLYLRFRFSKKSSIRLERSSNRSRSGGISTGKIFSLKYKSFRKRPSSQSCFKSRFDAAMTRASVFSGCSPPTRLKEPSCNACSNFIWAAAEIVPISSKKIVPPCAISNFPSFFCTAPVNAPFSWPNSSLSKAYQGWPRSERR